MRLFLTSAGITNDTLKDAFLEFVGKSDNIKVGFIPTASKLDHDQSWVDIDRDQIKGCGASIIEIDLEAVDKEEILEQCMSVDVIWFNGGNTYYGLHYMHESGLLDLLQNQLSDMPYAGSSAGSMIMGNYLEHGDIFFPSDIEEFQRLNLAKSSPIGLINIGILPHFKSALPFFEKLRSQEFVEAEVGRFKFPILALSDGRALIVYDKEMQIVGDGPWKLYNSTLDLKS